MRPRPIRTSWARSNELILVVDAVDVGEWEGEEEGEGQGQGQGGFFFLPR